jgi:hypothetical protein
MEHSIAPNGRVEHALIGDSSLADWPGRLAASGRAWAAEAAVLATSGATLPRPATALELLDLADGRASRSSFTWVIQSDVGAASAAILKSRD